MSTKLSNMALSNMELNNMSCTQWETGIRTNEIGLMFKTEIGLMEIGLILF